MLKVVSLGVKRADNSIANSQTSSLCRFPASLICFSFCLACCSCTGDFTKGKDIHHHRASNKPGWWSEPASLAEEGDDQTAEHDGLSTSCELEIVCVFMYMYNCPIIYTFSPRIINCFNLESMTQIPHSLQQLFPCIYSLFYPNLCTPQRMLSINMCIQAANSLIFRNIQWGVIIAWSRWHLWLLRGHIVAVT